MKLQKIADETAFNELTNTDKAVITFSADWCGPCVALTPTLEELANNNPEITVGKVYIDENRDLAAKLGVRSIPTIFFFNEGEQKNRMAGNLPLSVLQKEVDEL